MNNIDKDNCRDLQITTLVNTLSVLISTKFDSADELALFSAVLTQMGDTLATIAARRALCEDIEKKNK